MNRHVIAIRAWRLRCDIGNHRISGRAIFGIRAISIALPLFSIRPIWKHFSTSAMGHFQTHVMTLANDRFWGRSGH